MARCFAVQMVRLFAKVMPRRIGPWQDHQPGAGPLGNSDCLLAEGRISHTGGGCRRTGFADRVRNHSGSLHSNDEDYPWTRKPYSIAIAIG